LYLPDRGWFLSHQCSAMSPYHTLLTGFPTMGQNNNTLFQLDIYLVSKNVIKNQINEMYLNSSINGILTVIILMSMDASFSSDEHSDIITHLHSSIHSVSCNTSKIFKYSQKSILGLINYNIKLFIVYKIDNTYLYYTRLVLPIYTIYVIYFIYL